MNNTYSDRLNMFNAVLSVCDSYPTAIGSMKVLKDGVEILRSSNKQLHEMLSEQLHATTTLLTQTKNETRDRAFDLGLQIALRIRSASMRLDQPMLADQLIFTNSGLRALTEKEQLFRLKSVYERAETNLILLQDWSVDKDMLANFWTQIAAFETLSGAPTDKINERAARTESLEDGIAKLLNFVRNDLKMLVTSMEMTTDAQFMRQFQRAARVRSTGGGGGSMVTPDLLNRAKAAAAAKLKAEKPAKQLVSATTLPTKTTETIVAPVMLQKTMTNVSTDGLPLEGQIFARPALQ
jgi:hypothetical protein